MIIPDWIFLGYHFRGTHAIRFIHPRAWLFIHPRAAAAAGLVTPLRACPVDLLVPALST